MKPRVIAFIIDPEDFIRVMERSPSSQEEFDTFVALTEKCLKDTEHIDWDIVYKEVTYEMRGGD